MKFRSRVYELKNKRLWTQKNKKGDIVMKETGFNKGSLILCAYRVRIGARNLLLKGMKKEPGIDGILVTIGLCIIALLLCVVMKNSLQAFITTIVDSLKTEAQKILTGVGT